MSDILFFHGFAASPQSLKRAVDLLREAGHHATTPHMASFSFANGEYLLPEQWLHESESVLTDYATNTRGDFCLAGHSLGGAICAHLLAGPLGRKFEGRVSQCAFLATPAGIDERFMTFWKTESSQHIAWPFGLQAHMYSFLKLADSKYAEVRVPSLVVQGGQDKHIPPSSGSVLCNSLGGYCIEHVSHPDADHFFPEKYGAGSDFLLRKVISFFSSQPLYGDCCDG